MWRWVRRGEPGAGELPQRLPCPGLRHGSYSLSFLERCPRAERALAPVVATSCLLGVSARQVERLAASVGVTGLPKSRVSAMAAGLDELMEGFWFPSLDGGPCTFTWIDARTQKLRENGWTVNVHCPVARSLSGGGMAAVSSSSPAPHPSAPSTPRSPARCR